MIPDLPGEKEAPMINPRDRCKMGLDVGVLIITLAL